MEHDHPRWRIRLSTLMLLVVIAALLFERWHRETEARLIEARLQARLRQAEVEAQRVQAFVDSGPFQDQQRTPNTGRESEAGTR